MVKLNIPDSLLQELRATAAVVCREIVFTRKEADGATTNRQNIVMEKAFHGSEGYASVLDEMMDGKGSFSSMFQRLELVNNREGNDKRMDGHMLELKELFHRRTGERFIVHERDFTREVLTSLKKGETVSPKLGVAGRVISYKASEVATNYKHALRFYKEYADEHTGNPSGMKTEDMAEHVLREMFLYLKGKKLARNVKPSDAEKTLEQMKGNYLFTGFFSFLLFGPQPMSGRTLSFLLEDDKNFEKVGRAAARAKDSQIKDAERSADVGSGGSYHRGVNMKDKASVAHMANSDHQFNLKHIRDMLVICNNHHATLVKELVEVNKMGRDAAGDDDIEQECHDWREDIKARLKALKLKRKAFEEEEEQSRKKPKSDAVTAYYEQVGSFLKPAPKKVTVDHSKRSDEASSLTTEDPVSRAAAVPRLPPFPTDKEPVSEIMPPLPPLQLLQDSCDLTGVGDDEEGAPTANKFASGVTMGQPSQMAFDSRNDTGLITASNASSVFHTQDESSSDSD